jgi:putative salt-induced outer membrane protein YdiY
MRFLFPLLVAIAMLSTVIPAASADTLTLKNGDRLTGTITDSDGKEITFKTDFAGDIKVKMSAVNEISAAKALYVVTPDKKTITGNVSIAGSDLVVHSETSGDVRVTMTENTIIRSPDAEQAYEKSLHPGLLDDWKGGVNIGFALARGNSDTTNLSTGLTADRKTLSDEVKVNASSIYTNSGPNTTGAAVGVTADEVLGGFAYDRNITKRLYGFGSGDFTHDALQDLVLRQIYTGGLGWHVINKPSTTLDTFLGVNYTHEDYSAGATPIVPGVDRDLPGLTAGENYIHKFGAKNVFTANLIFYPDLSDIAQYRVSLDSSFVTKMNSWLGWQTTVSDRYTTNPPIPGTKRNDVILSTGLNITFSH